MPQRPSQNYQNIQSVYQPPQTYAQHPQQQPVYYNYQQGPGPVVRTSNVPASSYTHSYSYQPVSNYARGPLWYDYFLINGMGDLKGNNVLVRYNIYFD